MKLIDDNLGAKMYYHKIIYADYTYRLYLQIILADYFLQIIPA